MGGYLENKTLMNDFYRCRCSRTVKSKTVKFLREFPFQIEAEATQVEAVCHFGGIMWPHKGTLRNLVAPKRVFQDDI